MTQSTTSTTTTSNSPDELANQPSPTKTQAPAKPVKTATNTTKKDKKTVDPSIHLNREVHAAFKRQCDRMKITLTAAATALITKAEFPPPRITVVELPAREDVKIGRSACACAILLNQVMAAITRIESSGVNDVNVLNDIRASVTGIGDDLRRLRAQ